MAKFATSRGLLIFYSILLIATIGAQYDTCGPSISADCRTPLGHLGECVPIRQCGVLLEMLTSRPLLARTIDFLKSSQCGIRANRNSVNVCCPRDVDNGNNVNNKNPNCRNTNLPSDCGAQISANIFGGTEISDLSEFPWMALLEYYAPNKVMTACGGVLLSERYVLTAAHCTRNRTSLPSWTLDSVRLGEYNTSEVRDCQSDGLGGEICSDRVVSVQIEEEIVHELYQPESDNRWHDIALLRLSRPVPFTNYIKPICLPATAKVPPKMWIAGWGATENGRTSDVKRKLKVPLADQKTCARLYKARAWIDLVSSQLCAGGELGKDSCWGDSGGPLASPAKSADGQQRWMVFGLTSFGFGPCGKADSPSIYTKVIDYVPWILRNIRP